MTSELVDGFIFAFNNVAPLLLLLIAGKWLARSGQIGKEFLQQSNHLLYLYGIPGVLFFNILASNTELVSVWRLVLAGYMATIVLYVVSVFLAKRYVATNADKGVFIQGVFRGNLAVLSLAIITNIMGDSGKATASVVIGSMVVIMNILAVACLAQAASNTQLSIKQLTLQILKNPIIIWVVIALIIKLSHLPLPKVILNFAGLYTKLTLPLALVCVGAGCNFKGIFKVGCMAIGASMGRLLLSPLIFFLCAWIVGLRGINLAMMSIMGCAPAATAGYVMAKSIGGNAIAAANIITITIFGSMITVVPALAIFRALNWL